MAYSNSPLVSHINISPNRNSPRNHAIDRITIHCVVGQCSVETLGQVFAPVSRQASSNYGVGFDGRIGMYCPESDRSWCSSSADNDNRAITIETASDTYHPYAVNGMAYNALINLCVDICKRNGKTKMVWLGHCNYEPKPNEMLMTAHRWFASTICPGDYLYSRFGDIANQVNARLGKNGLILENGIWWYYINGVKATWFTGLVPNEYGYWYVKNGKIDTSFNDLALNEHGWWKCKNGKVDFKFNGLAMNKYGWWYCRNGTVDFTWNSVEENKYGWWYVKNGKVDQTYTGIAPNKYGWWRIVKGKVDFKCNTVEQNEYGWWKCKDGKVDFNFKGIGKNKHGWWYCVGGKVDFSYNGTYTQDNYKYIYTIKNGKVIKKTKKKI